ncbi:MAG TPA: hypothetical protein VMJ65_09305 [Solirubrobacteraceae bacterium]|nr:hypothetical protein [Solirubrobacteraceae bacterium]
MSAHAHTTAQRPFQPEIPRSRFALGQASYPRDPDELRLGRFSDGQQSIAPPEAGLHRGRFSQGQEALGDEDLEKHIRRRFSEGVETSPSTT